MQDDAETGGANPLGSKRMGQGQEAHVALVDRHDLHVEVAGDLTETPVARAGTFLEVVTAGGARIALGLFVDHQGQGGTRLHELAVLDPESDHRDGHGYLLVVALGAG